jgi:hypothetical protein
MASGIKLHKFNRLAAIARRCSKSEIPLAGNYCRVTAWRAALAARLTRSKRRDEVNVLE